MKLYLASNFGWQALDGLDGLAVLWSYYYAKDDMAERMEAAIRNGWHVFVDSGAFTAFTKGEPIKLKKYIEFCLRWQDYCEVICSLDVIGNWETSHRNYQAMLASGVDCIPVFHIGSPLDELRRMITESDYIALGIAGRQSERRVMREWLSKCWSIITDNNPMCKIHGFALTSFDIMRWFPWHSVDSSSWVQATKYARVYVHREDGLIALGQDSKEELRKLLPNSLTPPKDVEELFLPRKAPTEDYFPLFRHNALSMVAAAERITEMECSYKQQALMPFVLEDK